MALAVLPLLLGITYIVVFIGREKFGYSVPVSIIISSFLLYFSQILFSTFDVGMILFTVLGAAGLLGSVISLAVSSKKTEYKKILNLYFSPGFYTFLIVFLFALFLYGGRHFTAWDELSHWGAMVKEMMRLDKFYIVSEARRMAHKDYPPIIQLFELLICRFDGAYSEGKASTGIQVIILSFLVPLFSEKIGVHKAAGRIKYALLCVVIGLLMMVITVLIFLWLDPFDAYSTIMNDCAVSAISVYVIALALDEEITASKTKKCFLLISLFYLPLCKQIAIAFILLALFAIIISMIQSKGFEKSNRISNIIYLIAMVIIPILSLKVWEHVIAPYNFSAQFDPGKISVSETLRIMLGKGDWLHNMTYMKYLAALLTEPVTTGMLKIGYISSSVLALFLLALLHFIPSQKESPIINKQEYMRYLLVFIAGIIGYSFTIFVMYMYGFSEGEMLGLASYSRYMSTYVLVMYFLIVQLFLSKHESVYAGKISVIAVLCSMMVVLLLLVDQTRLTGFAPKLQGNVFREYQELASDIDSYVEFDDEVLLISDNNITYQPFLNYYCDEATLYGNGYWEGIPDGELDRYDYAYVINLDDNICELWSPYIEDTNDEITQGMYRVINEEGQYKLRHL